jgi:pimeloyl-ACP methyl ester carboxylesterase
LIGGTEATGHERVGEWQDRKRFPQVGRSVDIRGRALNLYCSGQGSPAVILESDVGAPGYSWLLIQREIAKFTRACWYDRAGYGWSDAGPFPNHSDSAARDLHKLLTAARVPPPYVLVGHSMGAFTVRVYNGFFPGEAIGMVLVDPMHEDATIHIHNHHEALRPMIVRLFHLLGLVGWWRFWDSHAGSPPTGWTETEWATLGAMRRKGIPAQPKEPPLWVNGEMARSSGRLGDMPLVVLSPKLSGSETGNQREMAVSGGPALQLKLVSLSTRGKQVTVDNDGLNIPLEAPNAVVDAVRAVISEIRVQ